MEDDKFIFRCEFDGERMPNTVKELVEDFRANLERIVTEDDVALSTQKWLNYLK